MFKYLFSVRQNAQTLGYTRIAIGDPNNNSFVFRHCSTSSSSYTFHIEKAIEQPGFVLPCIDRQIPPDEIDNHVYQFGEPLIVDWSKYNRVIITRTQNVMPSFLEHYLRLQPGKVDV